MADVLSEEGRIHFHAEFGGAESPVATAVAYGAQYGSYRYGEFKILGDLAETDTGIVAIAKSGGYGRLSGNNEDGKGVAIATETIMSPALNGTIVIECRLERAALTAGVVFVGLCGTAADDVAEPLTGATVTLTLTAANICGFFLDSQLTASTQWHMPYNGGTTTGPTSSTAVASGIVAVAGESDVLRLEVDLDGTARWYINGILEQTVEDAVSLTTLQAALVGCWGTTTTAADVDVDYFCVKFNRNWTR